MNAAILLAAFVELLLKSAAVLALAFAVLAAWREASAAARHLVWTLAITALLALPLTRVARPLWTVSLPAIIARAERAPAPVRPPALTGARPDTPLVPVAAARAALPWQFILLSVWLAGTAGILGYRALGSLQLIRLRRRSRPLEEKRILSLARAVGENLGRIGRTELRHCPACCVPLAGGLLRPVVLLPDAALSWTEARLSAALCHEFGHIQRLDGLTRLLAQLACALYWPNPLVWLAARRLSVAQEQACDDLVLRHGAEAADYANLLIQAVRDTGACAQTARFALAMAQTSTLEARVCSIVDERRNRRPPGFRALTLGAATALAMAVASALAQVGKEPEAGGPQILISATFLELADGAAEQPPLRKLLKEQATLTDREAAELMTALEKSGEADVLSAPRVITRSRQAATIKIVNELAFPTEWEPDTRAGAWKAKTSETNEIGITFGVTPELKADGAILLDMTPEVVELLGYRDLDAGQKRLAPSAAAPEGHRVQPVLSSRKLSASISLKSGQTAVLCGAVRETLVTVEHKAPLLGDIPFLGALFKSKKEELVKRQLWILVKAEQLEPLQ